MNFNQNASGPFNTVDACSAQLLQIDYVANYIHEFRKKIHSGNTEVDWQLAMKSLSGSGDHQKLILKLKDVTKAQQSNGVTPGKQTERNNPNEVVDLTNNSMNEDQPFLENIQSNDSFLSVANSTSTSHDPCGDALVVRKRHADQSLVEPNPKQLKTSNKNNESGAENLTVRINGADIVMKNNENGEERNFKFVTEFRGAKITIEIN